MKVTKTESNFFKPDNVEMRDALVEDLIAAERTTGKIQGFEFLSAVVSQVCVFDGQKLPPEEVKRLSVTDFLELSESLGILDAQTLQSESSILSGKESSANLG